MEPEPKNGSVKYVVGIIVVALIILGVSFASRNTKEAPVPEQTATTPTETTTEPTTGKRAAIIVEYTNNGFVPKSVEAKVGDTVTFLNKSSEAMWVGADEHPTHTEYDNTNLKEHCFDKPNPDAPPFDQCAAGNEYSFTFTKTGTWDYHNHRNARMVGTIIVK